MPNDRMPSISLGIIVPAGAVYDSHHHWHASDGVLNASVRFDAGGLRPHPGPPAALRELAAALIERPTEPTSAALSAVVVEGVAG